MRKPISLTLVGLLLVTRGICFAQAIQRDPTIAVAGNQSAQSRESGGRQGELVRFGLKPCPPNTTAQSRLKTPVENVCEHHWLEDRVQVRLNNGQKFDGKITAVRDTEFELTNRQGVTRQIADSDVKDIRKKKGFWHTAKNAAVVPDVWGAATDAFFFLLWLGCRKGCDW